MLDNYKINKVKFNEVGKGFIYIHGNESIKLRSIVAISVKIGNRKKTIFCEALDADSDFLRNFNLSLKNGEKVIFMDKWYRDKLRIDDLSELYSVKIIVAKNSWKKLWFSIFSNMMHPQNVVRTSFWLAIVSIVLSIISSYILPIISLLTYFYKQSYLIIFSIFNFVFNIDVSSLTGFISKWQTLLGAVIGSAVTVSFVDLSDQRKRKRDKSQKDRIASSRQLVLLQNIINKSISIKSSIVYYSSLLNKIAKNIQDDLNLGIVSNSKVYCDIPRFDLSGINDTGVEIRSNYIINEISSVNFLVSEIESTISQILTSHEIQDDKAIGYIVSLSLQHDENYILKNDIRIKNSIERRIEHINEFSKIIMSQLQSLETLINSSSRLLAILEMYNSEGSSNWIKKYYKGKIENTDLINTLSQPRYKSLLNQTIELEKNMLENFINSIDVREKDK